MSNKTDLQILNSNYTALIENLRDKMVGDGSGGSVETCTVDLASAYNWELFNLIYSDGSEIVNFFPDNVYDRMNLTVSKNTLLLLETTTGPLDVIISGDAETVVGEEFSRIWVFSIKGNCSIDPYIGDGPM